MAAGSLDGHRPDGSRGGLYPGVMRTDPGWPHVAQWIVNVTPLGHVFVWTRTIL